MKKIILLLFLSFSIESYSQQMSIGGNVQDTITNAPLQNCAIIAVRIKDSILVDFTRTDKNGKFIFNNLPIDTLQIIISNPLFGDQYFYVFGSATNNVFDFGKIILPPKSLELKEVIIYAYKDPVYYKGDTLIYTADSFKVKPNATVEDLLKKLPGITVDANGKIKSKGKEVSQVLVDGDEFFGSDPTTATRNLAAKGVESVQVYEKKDENAEEGKDETVQVMNLKLKDEAKNGYFGKVSGASDFQKFYEGELLANKFKGIQKISVFALGSNTPKANFGWSDNYKYGLDNEMNSFEDDDGNRYWSSNNNDATGIPQTFKSGIYYNDRINKKIKLGFNYSYSNNLLNKQGATFSQYFLKDTSYVTGNSSESSQKSEGHTINFMWAQDLDSLTDLIITPKIQINSSQSNDNQITVFKTVSDTLMHQTNVENLNYAKGYSIDANAKLTKKFIKKDRLFSINYNFKLSDNNSNGLLKSYNTFFYSTANNDSIDQKKSNSSNSQTHNAMITYTEPLTKKIRIQFDYNFNFNNEKQNKKTQKYANGEYSIYDSLLTNDFENSRIINRLGTKYIFETKKTLLSLGAKFRNADITSTNIFTKIKLHQSINNVLPFLSYIYRFSQSSRFNFDYRTSSDQPSINQLQPILDNTNPNKVVLGNPNLVPTFKHNFDFSYNIYKAISGRNLWASLNFGSIENAFANSIIYDSIGNSKSQTVNVNGNMSCNGYVSGGLSLLSQKLRLSPNINGSYNSYGSFVNNQKNITNTKSAGCGLNVSFEIDTLDFNVSYNYDYFAPSASLSYASNKPYSEQQIDVAFTFRLPFKFMLETDASYHLSSKRAEGYNSNYILWNASLSKIFLKNENLILSLSGNDLLNQNISNGRIVQDNVITDSKTKIISQYFLLKLVFKFNSTHTKDSDDW